MHQRIEIRYVQTQNAIHLAVGSSGLDSARKVGQVDFHKESSDNYIGADLLEYGQTPSAEGYLIALRDTSMPMDKQAYIRLRLWRLRLALFVRSRTNRQTKKERKIEWSI